MLEDIKRLVDEALDAFTYDPPDTDFQNGYLAALQWIKRELDEKTLN